MGHWTKFYIDGSSYIGDDRDPSASWRGSRNHDIVAVTLTHFNQTMTINGVGNYWYSDLYEVVFPSSHPQLVARRIQKEIIVGDLVYSPNITHQSYIVNFVNAVDISTASDLDLLMCSNLNVVSPGDIGKWLTLTMTKTSILLSLEDHQL